MIFIAIAILFAALVPLFIIAAMALAALWSLVALVCEWRSARPAPAARPARPAERRVGSASRAAGWEVA